MIRRFVAGLLAFSVLACSTHEREDAAATHAAADTAALPPGALSLAIGTKVEATIQQSISSGANATGERVKAIVSRNVTDAGGRVVIPGGSEIVLTIAQLRPATGAAALDGAIALDATAVVVGASTYATKASVAAITHTLMPSTSIPANRDVVVTPGTRITLTLTQSLTISAS
jgi:hypothetical protein